MASKYVRLTHAALDEIPGGEIVLRGVIDPASFELLQAGDYQREIMPLASIRKLVEAYEIGAVPDIELGMRGQDFTTREDAFFLKDPVFIIDGLQRVTAAKQKLSEGGKTPHLGAVVHFGTTPEWERERFRILNQDRIKLSPNILLRNLHYDFPVVTRLLELSTKDRHFVLYDRISWNQRMRRQELITALTFCSTIGAIHVQFGVPRRISRVDEVSRGLQTAWETIGERAFVHNVNTFWNLIDEAFGIRRIAYKEGATHMRGTFLHALARVLGSHTNFWDGKKLGVDTATMRKIAQFPLSDPSVASMASSGGRAGQLLIQLLVEHINRGKRTNRLVPIGQVAEDILTPEDITPPEPSTGQ